MNDITTYYFSYTTEGEQMNYFTGETQTTVGIHNSKDEKHSLAYSC
ncbi:hypothetical protein ES708_00408 [subsurface metagenome]